MWRIVEAMTRLIAPILSFTAEEVWEHLPKVEGRAASVHVALFPEILEIVPGTVANVEADWEKLFEARETVMTQLEMLRVNKNIGKGLDASVRVIATEGSDLGLILSKYELALPEFFNVSQVTVQMVASTTNEAALAVDVNVASGAKCARCWRVVPDVGEDPRWVEVCTRCAGALEEIGYPPVSEEAA
jgi:isoleucyl-tRNA synthetase